MNIYNKIFVQSSFVPVCVCVCYGRKDYSSLDSKEGREADMNEV